MMRMQLGATLATAILLGACTGEAGSAELGESRAGLSKTVLSAATRLDTSTTSSSIVATPVAVAATKVDTSTSTVATPVTVVSPIDRNIIHRYPPIYIDPDPPPAPEPKLCSRTALWISPNPRDMGCPAVGETSTGSWKPRFVADKPGAPGVLDPNAPATLASVCAYDWYPRVDEQPNFAQLRDRLHGLGQQDPELDCPVMTGLGPTDPTLDRELWMAMRDTVYQQAGRPRGRPHHKATTFIGVVDSAAHKYTDTSANDTFGHGRLVGRMIQDLNCPDDGECVSVISNHPALLIDQSGNRNITDGGVVGTREDLAKAINAAVTAYIDYFMSAGTGPRGIINLSVGWDPIHGGGGVDHPLQLTPASYAVWAAMARAACVGMINVAAAGNSHGTSTDGAVLPAAWQNLLGPNSEQCGMLMYPNDRVIRDKQVATSVNDRGVPLCVAVAATDPNDQLLTTTRKHSGSRHVAYGLAVVTNDYGARGEHTPILTGSSFGPVVMSAALAAVWAVNPSLTPGEAIDYVYEMSEGLGDAATMPYLGMIQEQRRVSVCAAMVLAGCKAGSCDPDLYCDRIGARAGRPLWTPELFERSTDDVLTSYPSGVSSEPSALAMPWVCGQPLDEGCNRCSFRLPNRWLTISLSHPAATATKDIYVIAGGSIYYVPPPPGGYQDSFGSTLPGTATSQQATVIRNLTGGSALYEAITVLNE
jgi:hypothetical protein